MVELKAIVIIGVIFFWGVIFFLVILKMFKQKKELKKNMKKLYSQNFLKDDIEAESIICSHCGSVESPFQKHCAECGGIL